MQLLEARACRHQEPRIGVELAAHAHHVLGCPTQVLWRPERVASIARQGEPTTLAADDDRYTEPLEAAYDLADGTLVK